MPFFRISLLEGKLADYRRAIADGVHSAMRNPQSWPSSAQRQTFVAG